MKSIFIFRHFKCVEFMSEITNCMLSSYNVLPGQPRNFKFSNVGTNIGILHWDEPFEHKDTIDGYRVTYTLIQPGSRGSNEKQTKISSRYRTYTHTYPWSGLHTIKDLWRLRIH